jgi:pimeloyl-ACP methyl ester carboxylesterase
MSFDLPLAIRCAKAIRAVADGSLAANVINKMTDTQVRIEEAHDGEFIIIFPGSASWRDWLTNSSVRKTEWHAGVKVHEGFMEAFRSVAGEVMTRVSGAASVIITGHSLGGALATLCADACADMGVDVEAVYTFGSPRVGNGAFARQYNDDLGHVTYRVVNARDPVPKVPWMLGTYRHVDTLAYLHHDGSLRLDQPLRAHAAEVVQRAAAFSENLKSDFIGVDAHVISAYIKALQALPSDLRPPTSFQPQEAHA